MAKFDQYGRKDAGREEALALQEHVRLCDAAADDQSRSLSWGPHARW